MGGKFSPVIIFILLVVVVAIGILIFNLVTSPSTPENTVGTDVVDEAIKPIINLSKEQSKENSNAIKIIAEASIEEEQGIKEIVLPDGTVMAGDRAEYLAEANGEYEFTAIAYNGEETTLIIEVTEVVEASYTNPYIPEGFEEVGGDVETGYVIEDKFGNQYVWVPVPSGKLTRNTILDMNYEEKNTPASALVNSVAQYYGFYIGRFEASQYEKNGKIAAASMAGEIPWTQVTYIDAFDYATKAAEVFGYTDCYTSLINSYAWDTTLAWFEETVTSFSTSPNYGNYSGTIYPTGSTETDKINNICDIAGNVREWTTEKYQATLGEKKDDTTIFRVIRGGSANLSRTPGSHIGYAEDTSDPYWGFRTLIYK